MNEAQENLESQIINLEIKVTHQESLIEELNKALCQQQMELTQVRKTLEVFIKQYRAKQSEGEALAHEKPPHY